MDVRSDCVKCGEGVSYIDTDFNRILWVGVFLSLYLCRLLFYILPCFLFLWSFFFFSSPHFASWANLIQQKQRIFPRRPLNITLPIEQNQTTLNIKDFVSFFHPFHTFYTFFDSPCLLGTMTPQTPSSPFVLSVHSSPFHPSRHTRSPVAGSHE